MEIKSCTIIINRLSDFKNSLRSYLIYLDGKKINKIKNGDKIKISTQSGSHQIGVKFDLVKSDLFRINIREGETKHIEISLPPSNWKSKFSLILVGLLAGIGAMLFGAIGGGLGAGLGAIVYGAIACKPQINESKIL